MDPNGPDPNGPDQSGAQGSPLAAPSKLAGGLYVVATPIGNAADITLRALDTLKRADAIACEDTRVTAKLMGIHGIHTPFVSYHEHNAAKMRPILIGRMKRARPSRWSPTPARRWSPTQATSWCGNAWRRGWR